MPVRAHAALDAAAVAHNVTRLRRALTGRARLGVVVKAEGYGHGAAEAARAARAAGADWLAVATGAEAAALRAAGLEGRILVMGALTPDEVGIALDARADVVAWTEGFVARVAALGGARVHVKLDTGMGRLGTRDPQQARAVVAAAAAAEGVEVAGAMTHFATADERDDPFMAEQLAAFRPFADEVRAAHPGALAHAANSAATLRDPATHLDLVRAGVAVYGLDPFQRDASEQGLRPVLRLTSTVAAVKPIGPGQSIGYGRRFVADRETTIATLPIGYGDGWRRALTNAADVLIRGRRHPLAGTVSMDNVTVDVGPVTDVEVGDEAVLIGAQGESRITAEEIAGRLGTINYEVTTGLLPRIRREWR